MRFWIALWGVAAAGFAVPCLALEAVVQSDVGSGSAVAGSIGAVNARADALQGNVNATNLVIQQLQREVSELKEIIRQIATVSSSTFSSGTNGTNGTGVSGTSTVSATIKLPKGSWCGILRYGGTPFGSTPYVLIKDVDWRGQPYYLQVTVIAHSPCMGEPLVDNSHLPHCPSGYTFAVIGEDTSGGYIPYYGPDGNNASPGNYSTKEQTQATCLKN